jgi:thioredoxin-related protein
MRFRVFVIALGLLIAASSARAAELVMFEDAGCVWCARFNAEIGPIYPKTAEAKRAPLRHVDVSQPIPPELQFIDRDQLTPLFVLIENGREIGRIRGYPGEDHFWGLLEILLRRLPPAS